MKREKATLIHSTETKQLVEWSLASAADSRTIRVWNYNLLHDSLHLAHTDVDIEVVRVIFDQSVSAQDWLEFLSDMPAGFRGDVLLVVSPDKGFLSAVGRSDERVIYKLGEQDIRFYLEVSGIQIAEPLVMSGAEVQRSLSMVM